MSKGRNVSESDIYRKLREVSVEATAKGFKYVHDCYPRAAHCGRCGAKKGCCGCVFFPYLGADALYQLSRMHAQNVSHMVRMGLSTWDILAGGGRCRHCDHEECRCNPDRDHGCSRCSCWPCRCQQESSSKASQEANKYVPTRSEFAGGGSIETVTERLKYDPKSPSFRPYTLLEARNRSDAPVKVEVRASEFVYGDNKKVHVKPALEYSAEVAVPQRSVSVYVYFNLKDLMVADVRQEKEEGLIETKKVVITPLTGYLSLHFNDNLVARTKVILEVNQFKGDS